MRPRESLDLVVFDLLLYQQGTKARKVMRRLHAKELRIATRTTSRAINRQIVLNLLRTHQPVSRAALARLTGMQRSAMGLLVNELMAQGLVREGATGEASRGRKPTLLHLDSRGRCT